MAQRRISWMLDLAAVSSLAAVSGALAFVGIPLDLPGHPRPPGPPAAVEAPAGPPPVAQAEVRAAIRELAHPRAASLDDDPFASLLPPARAFEHFPPEDLRLSPIAPCDPAGAILGCALGERMARAAPLDDDNARAVDLLFLLGASYHAMADYERAAEYYEAFARHAPASDGAGCDEEARRTGACPDAPAALENAMLFRRALGQPDRALDDAELYERWYGETRIADAARVAAQAGAILEADGAPDEAASHYARTAAEHGRHLSPAASLRLSVRLGRARFHAGERSRAARIFRRVVGRWQDGLGDRIATAPDEGEDSGAEFSRTLAAVAEAAYMLAELRFEAFRSLRAPAYEGPGSLDDVDGWVARELRPWVIRKAHALRDARDAYERVASLGVTEHQIAARARIGQMFRMLMDDLAAVPAPTVVVTGDEQVTEIRAPDFREPALAQLRGPALEAFEQCLRTAVRTRHFGKWSTQCADELTRIDPRAHPPDAELRPTRLHVHETLARARRLPALGG